MTQQEFGTKLKSVRESKKLTQEGLAQLCRINIRTIQRIEQGKVVPRLYTLKILSDILEYDFNPKGTDKTIESMKASFARRNELCFKFKMGCHFFAWDAIRGLVIS